MNLETQDSILILLGTGYRLAKLERLWKDTNLQSLYVTILERFTGDGDEAFEQVKDHILREDRSPTTGELQVILRRCKPARPLPRPEPEACAPGEAYRCLKEGFMFRWCADHPGQTIENNPNWRDWDQVFKRIEKRLSEGRGAGDILGQALVDDPFADD